MDVSGIVIGLVGGSTVTAIWTASHQRAERHRERLLEAADGFLAANQAAIDAVTDLRRRCGETLATMAALGTSNTAFHEALAATNNQVLIEQVIERLALLTRYVRDERGDWDVPFSAEVIAEMKERFAGARADVLDDIDAAGRAPELSTLAESLFRDFQAEESASSRQRASYANWAGRRDSLRAQLPGVRLLYAAAGSDDSVTRAANDAMTTTNALGSMIMNLSAKNEDPGFKNDDVTSAHGDAIGKSNDFASAANKRITASWWRVVLAQ
jgi:hypothetical protein